MTSENIQVFSNYLIAICALKTEGYRKKLLKSRRTLQLGFPKVLLEGEPQNWTDFIIFMVLYK